MMPAGMAIAHEMKSAVAMKRAPLWFRPNATVIEALTVASVMAVPLTRIGSRVGFRWTKSDMREASLRMRGLSHDKDDVPSLNSVDFYISLTKLKTDACTVQTLARCVVAL